MYETTTTGTNINYNAQYCISRLPCGYCILLNSPCPMFPTQISPTWKVTCEGKTDSDSTKWTPDPNVTYTATNAKEGVHDSD